MNRPHMEQCGARRRFGWARNAPALPLRRPQSLPEGSNPLTSPPRTRPFGIHPQSDRLSLPFLTFRAQVLLQSSLTTLLQGLRHTALLAVFAALLDAKPLASQTISTNPIPRARPVVLPNPAPTHQHPPSPGSEYERASLESQKLPLRPPQPGALFEKVSPATTGINLVHQFPQNASLTLMQEQGAGAGVCSGDVTGDGLPDLFFSQYSLGCRLYQNQGAFRFVDITEPSGILTRGQWCTGVSCADVDNDGDLDLYVCCLNAPNLLFLNRGDGVFTERAANLGLNWTGASTLGAFADYDRDGRLDLLILTHRDNLHPENSLPNGTADAFRRGILARNPSGRPEVTPAFQDLFALLDKGEGRIELAIAGQPDQLFRQLPDGTFTNVTTQARLTGRDIGLGVAWWDFNSDGWPDLYIANDHKTPDRLWRNNRDGTFTDVAPFALPRVPLSSMGTDVADLNNDGFPDLLATDMAGSTHARRMLMDDDSTRNAAFIENSRPRQFPANALFLGTGTDHVFEAAHLAGLEATDWTWSPKFGDFDNDGLVDLFIANGMARDYLNGDQLVRIKQAPRPGWRQAPLLLERNLAYRNAGNLHWNRIESDWGLDEMTASFGATVSDLDRDGNPDLVVMNLNSTPSVYHNREHAQNRITLRLKGTRSNRWGVGAVVRLESDGRLQSRTLQLVSGFMSGNEPLLHFGLGPASQVDRLEVIWPSGSTQALHNLPANHAFTLDEPSVDLANPQPPSPVPTLFRRSLQPEPEAHRESPFDDFSREPLLPWKLSRRGPSLATVELPFNGRWLPAFYLGGAAGFAGRWMPPNALPKVPNATSQSFQNDRANEDLGAVFIDADGDGDSDLYVVSGGVEIGEASSPPSSLLQDRLYLAQTSGELVPAPPGSVPTEQEAGSVVCAADFDRDGDLDLFVGGDSVPGRYPLAASSRLLRNQGGRFADVTSEIAPVAASLGVVTSALWSDANGDGWLDLVVTEEWGSLRCLLQQNGRFTDASSPLGFTTRTGLWSSLAGADVDNDGDIDYIAGNLGTNSRYRTEPGKPLRLLRGDFQGAGITNLVEAWQDGDRLLPFRSRTSLRNAFPFLGATHPTFQAFAQADLYQLFPSNTLATARHFTANTLESGVWLNESSRFRFVPLPRIAQLAPTFGLVAFDANGDGWIDLALIQNLAGMHPDIRRIDGSLGCILLGKGEGTFAALGPRESGFVFPHEGRSLVVCDPNTDGFPDLVAASNSGPVWTFEGTPNAGDRQIRPLVIRLKGPRGNPLGIGARVTAHFADGRLRAAEVYAGGGYLSQSSPALFWSHQPASAPVSFSIRWPNGSSTSIERREGPFSLILSTD